MDWKTTEELTDQERKSLLNDTLSEVEMVEHWTDDHELCVGIEVTTHKGSKIKVSFWWVDLEFLMLVSKAEVDEFHRYKLQEVIKEMEAEFDGVIMSGEEADHE